MNHIDKDSETACHLHAKAVTYIQENSSKPNNGNLKNSDEVLFQSNEAPIFTTDVVPRTVSRQVSNNAGTPGTIRRKMKGHVRNKSSKSGGSGGWGNLANGSFKPGHKRNQSVLSKISKLSILTFGEGQELDDISSGDEEEEDEVDGIEMGSPSQFCEDLDCDHTVNGNCCKSLPHPQIKQTRLKKKKVKKRTPKEWVSDSYKNALSALHHLFCVSTKDLLGKWRFTRSLNWYSTPEYVNRLLMVGGKSNDPFLSEIMEGHITDVKKAQIKFSGNKSGIGNRYTSAKYTLLSFLPLNLMEQCRRMSNLYFIFILILCCFLYYFGSTQVDPKSWALSTLFIFVVTMIKQGYEDFLRHRNDRKTNKRSIKLISNRKERSSIAEKICVGDIISLTENDIVPCDAVLLSTSHESNQAYVMTANLDGETSLKTKFAAKLTQHLKTADEISTFKGCIECENPNPKLDSYLGRMFGCKQTKERISTSHQTCSLSSDNIILSGTQLKNTKKAFAVCVYSGSDTKIALNSRININKIGSVEKMLNRYVIYFFVFMLMEIIVFTIATMTQDIVFCDDGEAEIFEARKSLWGSSTTVKVINNNTFDQISGINRTPWYLRDECKSKSTGETLLAIANWMILFSYVIPISLFVSLEILRFLSSMSFRSDLQMYDEKRDIPAECHTSDINEELGLVTHLFTDKTGTLTQNVMVLKKYCTNANLFDSENLANETYSKFIMAMLLCHSVEVTNEGKFVASSPEEKTTLEVLKDAGYQFLGAEVNGNIKTCIKGKQITYKRLAELPFDSFRKCMTVVIKETLEHSFKDGTEATKDSSQMPTEIIHMLIKGADGVILPACLTNTSERKDIIQQTKSIVNKYASSGLRTLVYGYKQLGRDEFDTFTNKLEEAKQSMVNRVKFVREAYRDLEAGGLHLLGATAIEDKLQEDVAETILKLGNAGITTWMVTGDKKETAVNLGYAAGLLQTGTKIVDLSEVKDRKSLVALLKQLHREYRSHTHTPKTSLIIDGKGVSAIMKSIHLKRRLTDIASKLRTVVACRLSPVQKSQLVRMIKLSNKGALDDDDSALNLTAAIGDGGNDVSMIQEAHVGIGIIGHEGNAANAAADFAFTKFKYLQRAFLVHGHWYYNRLAFIAQYSFYKQIACFLAHDFYAIYSNYSATTMYSSYFLLFFNTFYTTVPVIVYGLFEKPYSDKVLLNLPELYPINRDKDRHLKRAFLPWLFVGIWHALVVFFACVLFARSNGVNGDTMDMRYFGDLLGGATVIVVNFKIFFESKSWNWLLVLFIALSILIYPILTFGLEAFYSVAAFDQFRVYQQAFTKESIISFMLFHILIIVLSLLPDFVISVLRYMRENFHMQQFDYKSNQDDMRIKFEAKNLFAPVSSEDCKLERFQDLSIIEDCDSNGLQMNERNKSKNNNDSVQTINMLCTNSASNETLEMKSSSGTKDLETYDNPSFESDIPKNLSNHSSKL